MEIYPDIDLAVTDIDGGADEEPWKSFREFLNYGGGLYAGNNAEVIIRYQYHYEGVPRKSYEELVTLGYNGEGKRSNNCARLGCTNPPEHDYDGRCRTCHIVFHKLALFQSQLGVALENIGFCAYNTKVRYSGSASNSLPDFYKIENGVLGILHADGDGHRGRWYEKDIQETLDMISFSTRVGIRRMFIVRYDHKEYTILQETHTKAIRALYLQLFDDSHHLIIDNNDQGNAEENDDSNLRNAVVYLNYDMDAVRYLEGLENFAHNATRAVINDDGTFEFVYDTVLRGNIGAGESGSRALYLTSAGNLGI